MDRWDVVDVVVVSVVVVIVVVHPRNLTLKFGWNQVSNSGDIVDIEFVWVGGGEKSNPTYVLLGGVELGLRQ